MAGDWIKMRSNLWDDPRVSGLCDLTDCSEAHIIGGLYWLWAAADQHSEDGLMTGLTLVAIDRKTGIKGFGHALLSIGWISESDDGIVISRFEEHNGASAKRRSMEAQRKANGRKVSASDADKPRTKSGQGAELEKEKEKEKEKDIKEKTYKKEDADTDEPANTDVVLSDPNLESDKPPLSPVSTHGAIATYVRSQGIHAVSTDQELQSLVKAGATMAHFVDAVPVCKERQKGWKYLLGIVKNMLQDAQAPPPTPTARTRKEPYDPRSYFEKDKPNDDNIIDAHFTVVGEK